MEGIIYGFKNLAILEDTGIGIVLLAIIFGRATVIRFLAIAESSKVIIDIEENTRSISEHIKINSEHTLFREN